MNTEDPTLAARFFFRNCAVSLHVPGEMRISRTLTPGPNDVVLDRDFTPAGSPTEFIGGQSDFYRFLDATSSTNASIIKKLTAIGYMLCNKLPRGGCRCRAFICVNEDKGACGNGKSLFAIAVSKLCNKVFYSGRDIKGFWWLSQVNERTNLLHLDDFPAESELSRLFNLCTSDWIILRKAEPQVTIPVSKAQYLLLTSDVAASELRKDGSFRRRFVALDFSSFFSPENTIRDYIGHDLFIDWNNAQWHMFDNFMFYCVLEYLHLYSRDKDVFDFYA